MKSAFISRDGSPLNFDPFNLGDGEAWNKTIVAPSGIGMSFHLCELIENFMKGSGACFVIVNDKGLTSKLDFIFEATRVDSTFKRQPLAQALRLSRPRERDWGGQNPIK